MSSENQHSAPPKVSPNRPRFASPWMLDDGRWFRIVWEEHRHYGTVKGVWRGPKVRKGDG